MALTTRDFFGMKLEVEHFDIDHFADLINMKTTLNKHQTIKKLRAKHGKRHSIISIAKRQILLKDLHTLLNQKLMPYDSYFYSKEVNTATDTDRQYGAEEKLLEFALIIATGEPLHTLKNHNFKPDTHALREHDNPKKSRFDRIYEILNDHTRQAILTYKKQQQNKSGVEEKPVEKKSLFKKLFS